MAEKYEVHESDEHFQVLVSNGNRGIYRGCYVAAFRKAGPHCPNAEREARNLCRRLNAAAKKKMGKVKR